MTSRIASALTLLLLLLSFPIAATAQDDLNFFSTAVPPNVVILLDNSGSMNGAMWHDGFDANVFYDVGTVRNDCGIGDVWPIPGSAGICPGSGDPGGQCPDSTSSVFAPWWVWCRETVIPGNCAAAPPGFACIESGGWVYFQLPDVTPGAQRTRWSRNYLSWMLTQVINGNTQPVPLVDRLNTARDAIIQLIDEINPDGFNDNVRFGLAKFNAGNDPDGGTIDTPVSTGNKNALIARLNNLQGTTWTPLSETLVDIAQYISGDGSIATCNGNNNIAASSPIDVDCRKSFVIILTDGEPTKDQHQHQGGTADFMCGIGNSDGDTNEVPTPEGGRTDAAPYQSGGTDWLDDVAFYIADNDLRDDLAGKQNIITYTIGFTIDHPLLRDTATNGDGLYFQTDNAAGLAADLRTAVLDIIRRATSFSTATVPSSRTTFADGFYRAFFIPDGVDAFWEGHFEAYRLSSTFEVLGKNDTQALDPNTGEFLDTRQPFWDVQKRLLAADHPARSIFTTKAGVRTTFDTASITPADMTLAANELAIYPNDPNNAINPLANPANTAALRDWLVSYIYGQDSFDQDRDGVTAELRDAVLGDIFHSNPIVIGPPPFGLSGEEGFDDFLNTFHDRERRIYFGANDGMLHGINAGAPIPPDPNVVLGPDDSSYTVGSGNEEFAYIPGFLLDSLKHIPINLPRSYYYVDGNPTAADAWLPDSPTDSPKVEDDWTTVLVTGMRQGEKGYLALDITDPGDATAPFGPHGPYPKLMWEFYDPNEPLGETWSDAIITRVKLDGPAGFGDKCGPSDGDGNCREQWVAIFGGGYAKEGDPNLATYLSDPNGPLWSDESKAVFMVALDTGQLLARLSFDPNDPQLEKMRYSIPSSPAVLDLDFDGFADVIYIGDLGGQLWKWDISTVGKDNLLNDGLIDNWNAGMFFRSFPETMQGNTLHYRSIFFAPSASIVDGDLILGFGTGERTDLRYEGSAIRDENNRFYVIEDDFPTGAGAIPDPNDAFDESDLTSLVNQTSDPDPTDKGFFTVAEDGEKFISNSVAFAGFLITTSFIPEDNALDICSAGGSAFLYIFDLETGGGFFSGAGSADQGRRLYIGDGIPTDPRISISRVGQSSSAKLFIQTSTGRLLEIDGPDPDTSPVELVYWKQDF